MRMQMVNAPAIKPCRRPTFFPASKLRPLDRAAVLQLPSARMLCGVVNALADLAGPKATLALLRDAPRLAAYEAAIQHVLQEQPGLHTQWDTTSPGIAAQQSLLAVTSCRTPIILPSCSCDIAQKTDRVSTVRATVAVGEMVWLFMQLIGHVAAFAGAHVLVLEQGTGILALLAARAGAGRVTCVARGRMHYRMAKQALAANAAALNAACITLLDRPLTAIRVAGGLLLTERLA